MSFNFDINPDPTKTDVNGDTALHLACRAEADIDPNLVDMLLNPPPVVDGTDEPDSGIGVDYIDARGTEKKTALHHATQKKDKIVVKMLLDKKADVTILDCFLNSPIHLAASKGYAEYVVLH